MLSAAIWPCRSATTQCSTRMRSPMMRIGPARDVAGGVDARRAGLRDIRSTLDALVDRQAGLLGERQCAGARRRRPPPGRRRACRRLLSVTSLGADRRSRVSSRWNLTPCSSCSARTKSPSCGPNTRSSGRFSGATTCTSMSRARKRCGDLQADEARADHDRALGRFRLRDDGAAVGERAQRMDVRLVGARNVELHRLGAGRQQQLVELDRAAVAERQLLAPSGRAR